jgi:Thoeris protein ThsA, Macro domain
VTGEPDLRPAPLSLAAAGLAAFIRIERAARLHGKTMQVLRSPLGRKVLVTNSLVAFGIISGGIEFLATLFRSFPPYPAATFAATLAICVAWGTTRAYPRFGLRHRMTSADITLSIVVGDLFAQDTHLVVGFSDTFDTAVAGEQVIHSSSVQGQLLRRIYHDDQQRLDNELSAALRTVKPVKKESRADKPYGKLARYPIGTVAVLGEPQRLIFAVAYGRMGNDMVVRSPVKDLWYCFSQLWEAVHRKGQHGPVSIPLMGSGLARINSLDHENLLRLILLSFVAYSRAELVCHELRIVIRPEDAARVDLLSLREFLRTF